MDTIGNICLMVFMIPLLLGMVWLFIRLAWEMFHDDGLQEEAREIWSDNAQVAREIGRAIRRRPVEKAKRTNGDLIVGPDGELLTEDEIVDRVRRLMTEDRPDDRPRPDPSCDYSVK